MKKNQVKINKNIITIKELKLRDGIEMVLLLARVVEKTAPYLAMLGDNEPAVRTVSLAITIQNIPDLEKTIEATLFTCTDITKIIYNELTFYQAMKIIKKIMKVNNWNDFWVATQSLSMVEEELTAKAILAGLLGR